jgi:kynurenine formamidase
VLSDEARPAEEEPVARIIDLSASLTNETMLPPTVTRTVEFSTYHHPGPGHWQASWASISVHSAAHVDSPLHVLPDQPVIGEIPLEKTIGELLVLDLPDKCAPDAHIGRADLERFDADFREDDIVMLKTGWSDRAWGTPDYWDAGPWVDAEAAEYLVSKKPKAVVFDSFEELGARNPNFKPEDFVMHRILLGAGIILIEGTYNVHQLTKKRYRQFFAAPLKMMEVEAAPARIFVIDDD